ncbi:MAG TPA: RagB/SusD family nutrient uptake outer membrane protein [Ohtaekwangia sp.]
MKKIYLTSVSVLLVLLSTVSCSDSFLEIESRMNEMETDSYKTEDDAMAALVAVYDALAVQNWICVPLQSDIFSDDQYTGGEPGGGMGQYQEQERSVISLENGAARDLWNKLYSGIYRANFFFYKDGDIDWINQDKRTRMRAEVKVLRAYFYWDLVRHYGWVPIIRETISDPEAYKSIPQSTPQEVYEFIAEDLLSAIPDLPLTVGSNEKGRITKDVARVLIARIFLFREGFAKPVLGVTGEWTDGTTVIDKAFVQTMVEEILSSNRYQLLDNYADIFDWENENNAESIFEWQYSEKANSSDWASAWGIDGNFAAVFYGPRSPVGDPTISAGWSFGTISWSLYDEFEAGDPRLDVTVYNADVKLTGYAKGFQNTGYFAYKYMALAAYRNTREPDHNWRINYKDMRLAELYLIAAELFLDSNNGKATDYLNEVRTRSLGDAAAKTSITLDDIYHERRVELAGEGHRKWDLLRRGLDYAKEQIDASWEIPSVPNAVDFQGRQFDTNTWGMLPIPASEVRLVNPGMLEQYVPAF